MGLLMRITDHSVARTCKHAYEIQEYLSRMQLLFHEIWGPQGTTCGGSQIVAESSLYGRMLQ